MGLRKIVALLSLLFLISFVAGTACAAQKSGDENAPKRSIVAPSDASAGAAQAAVPRLIKFNGTLRDLSGKPITGPADVTFSLYSDETGGNALWYETQTVQADQFGNYTVLLGAMTPAGVPMDLFTSGEAHWLGVQVSNLPEQPRVLLVSVPYAMKAGDAETLGGKPASDYLLASQAGSSTTSNTTSLTNLITKGSTTTTTTTSQSPVTNTITASYIPVYTDSLGTTGNSIMFQSGTKIGINTNTPVTNLDLNGAIFMIGPKVPTPGQPGSMRFRDDAGIQRWLFGIPGVSGSQDFFMFNYTNGHEPLYFENAAPSFSLYFKGNGNVGIGTNAPAAKLDVNGTARVSGLVTLTSGVTGNLKINGTGNALIFPDGTVMTSAGAGSNGGTITGVTAGTGLSGGGTSGGVSLSIASNACAAGNALTALPFTCSPVATLAANTFTGNQTVTGNVGASGTVTGSQLVSTVATGTSPLVVASTTQVANLNASMLGGLSAGSFATLGANAFVGDQGVTGNISASGDVSSATATVTGAVTGGASSFSGTNSSPILTVSQAGSGPSIYTQSTNASIGVFASANSSSGVGIEGSITTLVLGTSRPTGALGVNGTASGVGLAGVAAATGGTAGLFQATNSGGQILSGVAGGTAGTYGSGTEVFSVSYTGAVKGTTMVPSLKTVTFSSAPTFDASLGNTMKITLTGDVTSPTLSNATAGQNLNFIICQDATGGHAFAWPSNVKGGMVIGSTASTCNAQSFVFDGTNAYAVSGGVGNL